MRLVSFLSNIPILLEQLSKSNRDEYFSDNIKVRYGCDPIFAHIKKIPMCICLQSSS